MTTARKDAATAASTTTEEPTGTLATGFVDRRRITEDDPDFQRLHTATVRVLRRNIHQMVTGLRTRPAHEHQAVLSRFIHNQVQALRDAYAAGHAEGGRDYYAGITARATVPSAWLPPVDARTLRRRLGFYAPAVAKMAHEASRAWQEDQARKLVDDVRGLAFADGDAPLQLPAGPTYQQLPAGPTYQQLPAGPTYQQLPMGPGEAAQADFDAALSRWEQGLDVRVKLMANVGWTGLQDGYYNGPLNDPANPYYYVYWLLEPSARQHCDDCPLVAAGSPYTPPGSGTGNELTQTPGDGSTACGAACKCSLTYGVQYGAALPTGPAGSATGGGTAGNVASNAAAIDWEDALPAPLVVQLDGLDPATVRAILNPQAPAVPPPDDGEAPQAWEPSPLQLRALDLYRATALSWAGWASDLPPLPDFFGWGEDGAGFALPEGVTLSPKQAQLLEQVLEALLLYWYGGTDAGAALDAEAAAAYELGPNLFERLMAALAG